MKNEEIERPHLRVEPEFGVSALILHSQFCLLHFPGSWNLLTYQPLSGILDVSAHEGIVSCQPHRSSRNCSPRPSVPTTPHLCPATPFVCTSRSRKATKGVFRRSKALSSPRTMASRLASPSAR